MAPDEDAEKKQAYNAWFPGKRSETTTHRTDLKKAFGSGEVQKNYERLFRSDTLDPMMPNLASYRKTNEELGKRMGTAIARKQSFLEDVKEKYGTPEKNPEDGGPPKTPEDGKDEFKEKLADYLETVRRDYTRNWITPATGVSRGGASTGVLGAIRDEKTYFKLASDDVQESRDALRNDLGAYYVTMRAKGKDSVLDKMLGTIGVEKKYEARDGTARYALKSRADDAKITSDNFEEFLSETDQKRVKYVDSDRKADAFIEGLSKKLSAEYSAEWLSLNSRLGSREKHVSVYEAAKKDANFAKEAAVGNYESAVTNYISSTKPRGESVAAQSLFTPAGVPEIKLSAYYKKQKGDVELSVPVGRIGYDTDTTRKRFIEYRLVK